MLRITQSNYLHEQMASIDCPNQVKFVAHSITVLNAGYRTRVPTFDTKSKKSSEIRAQMCESDSEDYWIKE